METIAMIKKLTDNGYPLRFIAKQSGVSYMTLYRSINGGRSLTDQDEAAIKRFAIVQPCMER